jgi:hypothetical protein
MNRLALLSLFIPILLIGCAFNLATIDYKPVKLDTSSRQSLSSFVLLEDVIIHNAPCNYDRTLRAGNQWIPVGIIPLGAVYRSNDQILTIECSHIFEAYIVVSEAMLVGAYLPVEDSYVRLKKPIAVKIALDTKGE